MSPAAGAEASDEGLLELCHAIMDDLNMLASLHNVEPDSNLLEALRCEKFPSGLGLKLESDKGHQACEFMALALSDLPQSIDEGTMNLLAADYASIYLNHSIQASPEESVWIDEENLTYQDTMFQVRGWYAQHGLATPNWRIRPDDHLVLELQFIAHLISTGVTQARLGEAARFMDEHLLRWLMPFAERVAARCETPYFAAVAMLTGIYCEELRDLLAEILNEPRPSQEEIDQRMQSKHKPEPVPVKFMPGLGPAV